MFTRLHSFLEKSNTIFQNQYGFRKKHSTTHALYALTEQIRKAIDNNDIACGVFVDLKKAFDSVSHNILLTKLEYYGIRGVANNWFHSYLTNRSQFVLINESKSDTMTIKHGVPQGSILGPLLFLIYINDLHNSIKYSNVLHFADDTSLIIKHNSPKRLKKMLNKDLIFLCKWLQANSIALNAKKTELVIFRHPNKKINYDLKIKLHGKKLYPSDHTKYLGVLIDSHLNFNTHMRSIGNKLSRSQGMLSKLRHYVNKSTLKSIYYSIFSSLMTYASIIWGQNKNIQFKRLEAIQNKTVKTINFANFLDSPSHSYKSLNILKLTDNIKLQNFLFSYDCIHKQLPSALKNSVNLISNLHNYQTRASCNRNVSLPCIRTSAFGLKSISFQSAKEWNFFNNMFKDLELHRKSKSFCKQRIVDYFLNNY